MSMMVLVPGLGPDPGLHLLLLWLIELDRWSMKYLAKSEKPILAIDLVWIIFRFLSCDCKSTGVTMELWIFDPVWVLSRCFFYPYSKIIILSRIYLQILHQISSDLHSSAYISALHTFYLRSAQYFNHGSFAHAHLNFRWCSGILCNLSAHQLTLQPVHSTCTVCTAMDLILLRLTMIFYLGLLDAGLNAAWLHFHHYLSPWDRRDHLLQLLTLSARVLPLRLRQVH